METCQKAHPILFTLLKIQRKYGKNYSFPSQLTILKLLGDRQNIKKSIATLNRWLRVVEDKKYLVRRRRIKRDPVYGTIFKSTLYKVTIKGYWLLARLGVDVRDEIAKYELWREQIGRRKRKATVSPPRKSGLSGIWEVGIIKALRDRGT